MSSKPIRVQRKRTKDWRMPPNTIYVGRPTKWGNPYNIRDSGGSRAEVVRLYKRLINDDPEKLEEIRRELGGKDLACWCPPGEPCHADVLLELANRGE